MWIAKGILLGIWLFSFGTIAYLYLALFRVASGGIIAADLVWRFTARNVLWWLALVGCLATGVLITSAWSARPFLWLALALTELLPATLFTLFLRKTIRTGRTPLGDWIKKHATSSRGPVATPKEVTVNSSQQGQSTARP